MKITVEEETGLKFVAEKPDETLKKYWLEKLRAALANEFQSFMDEVAVAMRKLKPGESVTLESRPIKVTLQKEEAAPVADPDRDSR